MQNAEHLPVGGRARDSSTGWPLAASTLAVFTVTLAMLLLLYATSPLLHDTDAYYHLGIAREYAQHGVVDELRWVRFGLLSEHFADKEFLFHLLLRPFSDTGEENWGGRFALAMLGALNLALIAHLAMRAVGAWGLLAPFWLALGSAEVTWRLVRLRPELLSLFIIVLAVWLAGLARYRWLGLLGFLYALSYTAAHAFAGLFVILFAAIGWVERRWDLRLLLYPLLGVGLGLLVHPHFPDNLLVWWYQAFEFFRFKGSLDVGTEIRPNFTDVLLMVNLGWIMGGAIFWRSAQPEGARPPSDRVAECFGVAALVFTVLYLLMSRFSLYCFPLASLWLLFEIRRRGLVIGPRTRLPWRGHLPIAAAWLLCLAVSFPTIGGEYRRFRSRSDPGPNAIRLTERQEFARALPEDAHVVAPWGDTPIYLYWAPHGRYTNVLDPMFLAVFDPPAHRIQQAIFDGSEPDVPLAATRGLDSQFIAYPAMTESTELTARLEADPRVTALHRSVNALFQLQPAPGAFILDWRLVPGTIPLPLAPGTETASWQRYPRLEEPFGGLEGYVDARRVAEQTSCVAFLHRLGPTGPQEEERFEFAPYGPSAIWLDGRLIAQIDTDLGAVLGRGIALPLRLTEGEHLLTVLTCPDRTSGRHSGFYLRKLDPGSAPQQPEL